MNTQGRLQHIQTALTSIEGLKVYHYWRPKMIAPFCVWQEEEGSAIWASNHAKELEISGSVDYYTRAEFDPVIDSIQNALNSIECGWNLEDVQYEDDTNLIHYSWRFSVG